MKREAVYQEKKDRNSNFTGMMSIIMISVLFLLIGGMMMFVSSMHLAYFCYVTGGIFLTGGVWLILRYFIKSEYHQITNYDFSLGTLITIAGICILIRANDLTGYFYVILGALLLIQAVVLLQYAIQLKGMRGKSWSFTFILSLLFILFSVFILTDFKHIFTTNMKLLYILLLVAGVLGLLCLIMVAIRSYQFKKEMKMTQERNQEAVVDENPLLGQSSTDTIAADAVLVEDTAEDTVEDAVETDKDVASTHSIDREDVNG